MGNGAARSFTDLFSRLGARPSEPVLAPSTAGAPPVGAPAFPTKAFRRFLSILASRDRPVLVDLGAAVGPNVSYFGERFGCKLYIEDLCRDVERHAREERLPDLPAFLGTRLGQTEGSVDGILCWDIFDCLQRDAARVLASRLVQMLAPGGALLGFFSTAEIEREHYTKYLILDEDTLLHRQYAGTRIRQAPLQNRDVIRLFDGLLVSDSFLLKINTREILFRRPEEGARG